MGTREEMDVLATALKNIG